MTQFMQIKLDSHEVGYMGKYVFSKTHKFSTLNVVDVLEKHD